MESCRELRNLYESSSIADRPKVVETQRKLERVALRRCEAGVRNGCTEVALGPRYGDRVVPPEVKKQGLRLLAALDAKTCEAGDLFYCELASSSYKEAGEDERAHAFLLKGAALGHAKCKEGDFSGCVWEGRYYEKAGEPKKALAAWTPVCQGPPPDDQDERWHACVRIADLLAQGADGIPANRAASIPFYKRACLMRKESPCTRGPE